MDLKSKHFQLFKYNFFFKKYDYLFFSMGPYPTPINFIKNLDQVFLKTQLFNSYIKNTIYYYFKNIMLSNVKFACNIIDDDQLVYFIKKFNILSLKFEKNIYVYLQFKYITSLSYNKNFIIFLLRLLYFNKKIPFLFNKISLNATHFRNNVI